MYVYIIYKYIYIYLVDGFNHLEKYESQREGLSHKLWKIIQMFQTTNQEISYTLRYAEHVLLKM